MSLILSGTDGLSDVDGSAATPAIRGTDANTGIFFPAADTIAFAEGGAEVARFNSSGYFGIGTTSPSQLLHVNSAGAAIGIFQSTLAAGNTNAETRYISTNRTWGVGQNIIQTSSIFEIADVTASATRLAIDSSGNLGVGTTSPAAKAEVVSSTGAQFIGTFRTGDSTAANNSGCGFYGVSSATAGSRQASMWLDADGANFAGGDYFYILKTGNSGNVDLIQASNAAITFQTNTTERARITSAGDLLVGKTTTSATTQGGYISSAGQYVVAQPASTGAVFY